METVVLLMRLLLARFGRFSQGLEGFLLAGMSRLWEMPQITKTEPQPGDCTDKVRDRVYGNCGVSRGCG